MSAFVGREEDLAAVDELLRNNSRVNIAAAVGMGGVGKTELALQYAQRRGNDFAGGVCWLRGVEPVASQMIEFAQTYLGLDVPEQVEKPLLWCAQRWPGAETEKVLLVVDDVQDYAALREQLPNVGVGGGRFRVLLTTREAILPKGQLLALEVLTPGAALELLASLAPEQVNAEPEAAEELCEWVGRLPLGVELVGWHLHWRPSLTIATLLERLEEKKLAARALMTHSQRREEQGVAAAFEVSWEPLADEAKLLAGLLGLFAAAPVKWEWVQAACADGEVLDEEDLEEAQAELLRVNLLQVAKGKEEVGERRYGVHPLVREFFAVKLGELTEAAALQQGFAQAMTEVAKTIPQAVTVAVRARVADAVPHMAEVAQRWTAGLADDDKTWCCTGLGRFYESLSQWEEAERWRQRALKIRKAELGERHPDTAQSLNNLAALYESQGRYSEAEPLLVQALAICKAELGERHPNTAQSLNNLALLYKSQGRYSEAEPLYGQALAICKAELGERHPNTASSLNNLALLYRSQGRYSEAEPLLVQALAIRKAELGERHPDTASSLNNLAALYESQGRYSEAEPLYVQALAISKAELGERHPDTASSLNNLAALYESQGRYIEAEPLYVQALAIRKAELGERHPDTAMSLNNLAVLYDSQGRYSEAELLLVQALAIRKAELGERHPSTASSLNNLAALYRVQGRYSEAEPLLVQALAISKAELGERHPSTAQSLNNLAGLYQSQERYSEAEPFYQQSLAIRKAELGERHPDTASSLFNLAALYHNTEKPQQALSHIQQALDIYVPVLGENHPNTQAAISWYKAIKNSLRSEP